MRATPPILAIVLALAGLPAACSAGTAMTLPDQPAGTQQTLASAEAGDAGAALDAVVTRYLHSRHAISDRSYYLVGPDVPWVAVSKNVANQMMAKGRDKTIPEWHRAGMDWIDLYSGDTTGFAVAMAKDPMPDGRRLVGYYTLSHTGE